MRNTTIVIIVGLALGGCANFDYLADNYGNTPQVSFQHAEHNYKIFDKPGESRLMISTAVGAAMGAGFVRGLTFGLINNHPSEPVMRDAALAYLKGTGRSCTSEAGSLIAQPQWEFHYNCRTATAAVEPTAPAN